VVPNGVWVERLAESNGWLGPLERGCLSLAFLGALLPHKGLQVLLEALEKAALPAVDLAAFGTVGDPAWAREIYRRAEAIPGLRFRAYGEYGPDELPLLLADVDAVVTPSQWPETYCLVAYEALARGIPVLASRFGALPDAIDEGANGFSFRDAGELAGILCRLATDQALVGRLRAGARDTRVFSQGEHVAAIRDIYDEALSSAREKRPSPSDLDEIAALESTLAKLGFAGDQEAVAR
jgi:glycosyltransferase involved in cell wall biosynthesis